jgi:hypothetical protein
VDKQVIAVLARNKPVSLVLVKPFYFTFCHFLPFFLAPKG